MASSLQWKLMSSVWSRKSERAYATCRNGRRHGSIVLRAKSNLLNSFNLIWVVQSLRQKLLASSSPQISGFLRAVPSRQERRIAIVTNARRDVMDARGAQDEGARRVRRSRVVLTPRCWRQIRRSKLLRMTVATKPFTGEHEVSRKAIAQGRPECFR